MSNGDGEWKQQGPRSGKQGGKGAGKGKCRISMACARKNCTGKIPVWRAAQGDACCHVCGGAFGTNKAKQLVAEWKAAGSKGDAKPAGKGTGGKTIENYKSLLAGQLQEMVSLKKEMSKLQAASKCPAVGDEGAEAPAATPSDPPEVVEAKRVVDEVEQEIKALGEIPEAAIPYLGGQAALDAKVAAATVRRDAAKEVLRLAKPLDKQLVTANNFLRSASRKLEVAATQLAAKQELLAEAQAAVAKATAEQAEAQALVDRANAEVAVLKAKDAAACKLAAVPAAPAQEATAVAVAGLVAKLLDNPRSAALLHQAAEEGGVAINADELRQAAALPPVAPLEVGAGMPALPCNAGPPATDIYAAEDDCTGDMEIEAAEQLQFIITSLQATGQQVEFRRSAEGACRGGYRRHPQEGLR